MMRNKERKKERKRKDLWRRYSIINDVQ